MKDPLLGSLMGALRSTMEGRQSREPDLEQGVSEAQLKAGAAASRYTVMARYLDSDNSDMVYRRFGVLHWRILLQLHDEIVRLEQQLQELTEGDVHHTSQELFHKSASKTYRVRLLDTIKQKLSAYGG